MTALQTCGLMDNFDQKCCHITLSERKNDLKAHLFVSYQFFGKFLLVLTKASIRDED